MMIANHTSVKDDDLVGIQIHQNIRTHIDKKDKSINKSGTTYRGYKENYSYIGLYEKGKEQNLEVNNVVITAVDIKSSLPRKEKMVMIRKCKNVRNVVPVITTSMRKKKILTVYSHFDFPFTHYLNENSLSKEQFWKIIFDTTRAITDLQKKGCNPNTLLPRNFVVTCMDGEHEGSLFDYMDQNGYEQQIYYGKTFLGNKQQSIPAKLAYCILKFALQDKEKLAKKIPEADDLVKLFNGLLEPFRVYLLRDLLIEMVHNNNFSMMKFWSDPTWWNFSVVKDYLDCSRKAINGNQIVQEEFNSIYREAYRGWQRKIKNMEKNNEEKIEESFDFKNYGDLPFDLLIYLRNYNAHITENDYEKLRKYFQPVAMEEQFIKVDKSKLDICISVLLEIFPRLLHDVYKFNSKHSDHDILEGFYNGKYQSFIEYV